MENTRIRTEHLWNLFPSDLTLNTYNYNIYLQFVIRVNYISLDIRLLSGYALNLRYSGLLRSVGKWLGADVSGASTDPIPRWVSGSIGIRI